MTGQMKTVPVTEFKARCLSLLEDVARTGEPLIVTKRGKALARVFPSGVGEAPSPQETLTGTVTILGDVLEPVLPPEAWDAVRGEVLPSRSGTKRRR
jgi:prevent-host-death family protein